jgi:hypothetical protein
MPDPFASARRSLARGQHHIGDLGARLNDLNKIKEFAVFVVEPDPNGAHEVQKLRFHPFFRDRFPSIVFDAVSNFRSCLDQMTYAISLASGLPEGQYAYFPICKGSDFIDNQINGLTYVPPEIRTLFRSFNPYKGGNDFLWALGELCNVKKHAALVPINLQKPLFAVRPNSTRTGPLSLGGVFDPEKNEIEVMRFPKGQKPDVNIEITFSVVLHHPEKAINGHHPLLLLGNIRGEVERALNETEAECRRINLFP